MPQLTDVDFFEAIKGLENHRKGEAVSRHSHEKTLNRLFRKHLKGKPHIADNPPYLSNKNVVVTKMERAKQDFVHLAPDGAARHSEGPILIVKYRGVCCLIDGNHRVRAWQNDRAKHSDSHTAYVFVVDETKSA